MESELTREEYNVDLVLERSLGTGNVAQRLRGYLSLGAPVITPLTVEAAANSNSIFRSFLESQTTTSDYFGLNLMLSFRSAPSFDPFVRATVSVSLEAPDRGPGQQPLAWSISPKKRMHPVTKQIRASLTASLGFVESTIEYTPGLPRDEAFLVSAGERTDNPEWRFQAKPGMPLIGDEELSLVIKSPKGVEVCARVAIAATVKQQKMRGLIRYRAQLPNFIELIQITPARSTRESFPPEPTEGTGSI
jgi:hypothetical protein